MALVFPPSSRPGPRWGHGRPEHARLAEVIGRHEETYRASLQTIIGYRDDLLRLPRDRTDDPEQPYWLSAWLPGLDAAAIYAFLRDRSPALYVEVGSGVSTAWAAHARRDGQLETRIVSIDPQPRVAIDPLCDEVVRAPLEAVDPALFARLGPGDVLFVDDSHAVFTNSDSTAFFLDILPELSPGVLVGVHDVLLPADYLPEWTGYHWSEQYLLAAYLLAGAPWIRPILAAGYVSLRPRLHALASPLFDDPRMCGVDRRGFAFWLEIEAR